jgi:hypothetical protein
MNDRYAVKEERSRVDDAGARQGEMDARSLVQDGGADYRRIRGMRPEEMTNV